MRYLGGKARLAKPISQAILENTDKRQRYIEPFVGGGSVLFALGSEFEQTFASDIHEPLILMYQAIQKGWQPPHIVKEEDYQKLKEEAASALQGFVGNACSFGGKWFGGYARSQRPDGSWRNFACESANRLDRNRDIIEKTRFGLLSYQELQLDDRYVVYCDPPYSSTEEYADREGFDSGVFWDWAKTTASKGADVFVSEFTTPKDTTEVWSKPRKITIDTKKGATKIDRLVKVHG